MHLVTETLAIILFAHSTCAQHVQSPAPLTALRIAGVLGQMHGLSRQLSFVERGGMLPQLCARIFGYHTVHSAGALHSLAMRTAWIQSAM